VLLLPSRASLWPERRHAPGAAQIRQLFSKALQEAAVRALEVKGAHISWGDKALDFLLARVEFDGAYPLEGAVTVKRVMIAHVDRLVRTLPAAAQGGGGGPQQQQHYELRVAGAGLALEKVRAAAA
jgi:hypothetical protein